MKIFYLIQYNKNTISTCTWYTSTDETFSILLKNVLNNFFTAAVGSQQSRVEGTETDYFDISCVFYT